ncbi:MAG: Panacea domain-containing protein [Rhodovarius sp.]|nr:Panacea domain-containing protein [Rhodovarius sp.]
MTMSQSPPIRFRFAPAKAMAALQWMLEQAGSRGCDLHCLLKACYFADKAHLNLHGRPVFGATYRAMRFGPVPLEIYEMLKGEPLHLADLGADSYPWILEGYMVRLREGKNAAPDEDALSTSDWREVKKAFEQSRSMSFDERTAATHGPDWQRANLGIMRYEDMLDEDIPDRAARIAELAENARWLAL